MSEPTAEAEADAYASAADLATLQARVRRIQLMLAHAQAELHDFMNRQARYRMRGQNLPAKPVEREE
jgi:hypothetical protein